MLIQQYLQNNLRIRRDAFRTECRAVYTAQTEQYPANAWTPPDGYPEGNRMQRYPSWEEILPELQYFLVDSDQIAPFRELQNADANREYPDDYKRINIVKDQYSKGQFQK